MILETREGHSEVPAYWLFPYAQVEGKDTFQAGTFSVYRQRLWQKGYV